MMTPLPPGLTLYQGQLRLEAGMLNRNTLLVDAEGRLLCWRQRVEDSFGVQAYLAALYEAMGLSALAGRLRIRSIEEQVEFSRRCQAAGIPVPAVIQFGADWMVSTYIPGATLKATLEHSSPPEAIARFLDGVRQAHQRGIALMDRWGGNEIVTPEGRVVFLDFDVQVTFACSRPLRAAAAFDLAVALRACCLWSSNKAAALGQLTAWWDEKGGFYDGNLVIRFLNGACDFYAQFDRQVGLSLSVPWSQHSLTNAAISQLIAHIAH